MKWNLFKRKPQAMRAPEPTGATTLTAAPPPAVPTVADNSTGPGGPINRKDFFEEIKNKFVNEIDKIPRECPSPHINANPVYLALTGTFRNLSV